MAFSIINEVREKMAGKYYRVPKSLEPRFNELFRNLVMSKLIDECHHNEFCEVQTVHISCFVNAICDELRNKYYMGNICDFINYYLSERIKSEEPYNARFFSDDFRIAGDFSIHGNLYWLNMDPLDFDIEYIKSNIRLYLVGDFFERHVMSSTYWLYRFKASYGSKDKFSYFEYFDYAADKYLRPMTFITKRLEIVPNFKSILIEVLEEVGFTVSTSDDLNDTKLTLSFECKL